MHPTASPGATSAEEYLEATRDPKSFSETPADFMAPWSLALEARASRVAPATRSETHAPLEPRRCLPSSRRRSDSRGSGAPGLRSVHTDEAAIVLLLPAFSNTTSKGTLFALVPPTVYLMSKWGRLLSEWILVIVASNHPWHRAPLFHWEPNRNFRDLTCDPFFSRARSDFSALLLLLTHSTRSRSPAATSMVLCGKDEYLFVRAS
mmetsp:Transcript_31870/g.95390  ORF Transcript_31870/g.95390 Transcript_31870/m.95390 type:complete len:206 (-) Transcript_31870:2815-3432(-)